MAEMEAFECHSEFTRLLSQNLSSARVVKEIISFAYSQISHSDVLFPVLIDSIREAPVMKRLSQFYLVDALYKYAPEQFYGKQILRNLKEIVDLTVDYQGKAKIKNQEKSGGFLNVQGVRKVLGLWNGKGLIDKQIFEKMDKYLSAMQDFDRYYIESLQKDLLVPHYQRKQFGGGWKMTEIE
jgi:CTD kinase subunit gamma CTK3